MSFLIGLPFRYAIFLLLRILTNGCKGFGSKVTAEARHESHMNLLPISTPECAIFQMPKRRYFFSPATRDSEKTCLLLLLGNILARDTKKLTLGAFSKS